MPRLPKYRNREYSQMDADKILNHDGHEEHDGSLDGAESVPQRCTDLLKLCAAVYAGLSDSDVDQIEKIATDGTNL